MFQLFGRWDLPSMQVARFLAPIAREKIVINAARRNKGVHTPTLRPRFFYKQHTIVGVLAISED